jgi:hypothetical protein
MSFEGPAWPPIWMNSPLQVVARLPTQTLRKRSSSPLQQRPATALAIFSFALIISLYFWFIQHYSVNTIWVVQSVRRRMRRWGYRP